MNEVDKFPCADCYHLQDVHILQDDGGCGDSDCCGGHYTYSTCIICTQYEEFCRGFREMTNLEYLEYKLKEKEL